MFILIVYKADFDADENLIMVAENCCVSENIELLKYRLMNIIDKKGIELNEWHKKHLVNNDNFIEIDFSNRNCINYNDIVGFKIEKIEKI